MPPVVESGTPDRHGHSKMQTRAVPGHAECSAGCLAKEVGPAPGAGFGLCASGDGVSRMRRACAVRNAIPCNTGTRMR
jgi:hypothetical protein